MSPGFIISKSICYFPNILLEFVFLSCLISFWVIKAKQPPESGLGLGFNDIWGKTRKGKLSFWDELLSSCMAPPSGNNWRVWLISKWKGAHTEKTICMWISPRPKSHFSTIWRNVLEKHMDETSYSATEMVWNPYNHNSHNCKKCKDQVLFICFLIEYWRFISTISTLWFGWSSLSTSCISYIKTRTIKLLHSSHITMRAPTNFTYPIMWCSLRSLVPVSCQSLSLNGRQ